MTKTCFNFNFENIILFNLRTILLSCQISFERFYLKEPSILKEDKKNVFGFLQKIKLHSIYLYIKLSGMLKIFYFLEIHVEA